MAKKSEAGVLENKETGDFHFVELTEVSIPKTHQRVHPLAARRAGSKVLTTLTEGAYSFVHGGEMTLSALWNTRDSDIITRDNFCDLFHRKAEDGVFRSLERTFIGRVVVQRDRSMVLEEAAKECALIKDIEQMKGLDFTKEYFAHAPGTPGGDCLHRLPGINLSVYVELTKTCKLEPDDGKRRVGFMADEGYKDMVNKK
jgi:hypothetical protein